MYLCIDNIRFKYIHKNLMSYWSIIFYQYLMMFKYTHKNLIFIQYEIFFSRSLIDKLERYFSVACHTIVKFRVPPIQSCGHKSFIN